MSMEPLDTELFLQRLDSEKEKLAEKAANYIRLRLRELSFSRKILTPDYLTKFDCQRSVQHDQLVKIVDLEPNSRAMTLNFRGRPDTTYVMGERYEIPFFTVSSEEFQKLEEELLAYEMPIMDLIERNAVVDIQTIEDEEFISRVEAALAVSGKYGAYSGTGTWSSSNFPKGTVVSLMNTLENAGNTGTQGTHNFGAKRYETDTILMNQRDFNNILLWAASDVGDSFATEVTMNGYTYAMLMGKKIISTLKGELVPPTTMYGFAAKPYIGHSFILNDTKFWIEKRKNLITWSAYETIGSGIGNVDALAKVSGS